MNENGNRKGVRKLNEEMYSNGLTSLVQWIVELFFLREYDTKGIQDEEF